MLNLSPRQKFVRMAILDRKITKENTAYLSRKDKADMIEAVGQRISKTKRQVQNIVQKNGLCLDKYKSAGAMIDEAMSYYQ